MLAIENHAPGAKEEFVEIIQARAMSKGLEGYRMLSNVQRESIRKGKGVKREEYTVRSCKLHKST